MSEEYTDNKIETKAADSSSGSYAPPVEKIPAKEAPEQELYHAKSYWTKWVFSQDAKVIGVQYALTATAIGMIGLVLSWGMRLQLGFPETFSFLGPATFSMVLFLFRSFFCWNFFYGRSITSGRGVRCFSFYFIICIFFAHNFNFYFLLLINFFLNYFLPTFFQN